jgi:hypothetical protein
VGHPAVQTGKIKMYKILIVKPPWKQTTIENRK